MDLLEPVKCPVCKDDDCVESEKIDNCTACGWGQVTPLDQCLCCPTDEPAATWKVSLSCGKCGYISAHDCEDQKDKPPAPAPKCHPMHNTCGSCRKCIPCGDCMCIKGTKSGEAGKLIQKDCCGAYAGHMSTCTAKPDDDAVEEKIEDLATLYGGESVHINKEVFRGFLRELVTLARGKK